MSHTQLPSDECVPFVDPSWGFTPLLNRSFASSGNTSVFGELVVPIRFQIDPAGSHFTSIGFDVHAGIGF